MGKKYPQISHNYFTHIKIEPTSFFKKNIPIVSILTLSAFSLNSREFSLGTNLEPLRLVLTGE